MNGFSQAAALAGARFFFARPALKLERRREHAPLLDELVAEMSALEIGEVSVVEGRVQDLIFNLNDVDDGDAALAFARVLARVAEALPRGGVGPWSAMVIVSATRQGIGRRPSGGEEGEDACRGRCGGGSASPTEKSIGHR